MLKQNPPKNSGYETLAVIKVKFVKIFNHIAMITGFPA